MGGIRETNLEGTGIETERFKRALDTVDINRKRIGIGTQSERTVHAVLKYFYEPDHDHQEIPIDRFIADIYRDDKIIEIQTKQLFRLKEKLDAFLENYDVTVVHPIIAEKWIIKIDKETGEICSRKKSPRRGKEYELFEELYGIKNYLTNTNLHVKLVMLQAEEYRIESTEGKYRRKGYEKIDTVPTALLKEIDLYDARDYMQFIPYTLDEFTVDDFAKEAKISKNLAQNVVPILYQVGMITRVGKKGKAYMYHIVDV